jgi:amphi-Trp domain-containing protein
MAEATDLKYSDKMGSKQAAEYLTKLADGIRNGQLTLQAQGHTITIVPRDIVKLKVHATSKEGKGELELEVSWREKYVLSAQRLDVETGATKSAPTQPAWSPREPR